MKMNPKKRSVMNQRNPMYRTRRRRYVADNMPWLKTTLKDPEYLQLCRLHLMSRDFEIGRSMLVQLNAQELGIETDWR